MRRVIVESPYAAPDAAGVAAHEAYARRALADCLARGEAPLCGHLLYTQPGVLDDRVPAERALGIAAHLAWAGEAEATVVYADRGVSPGMEAGIRHAHAHGRPVEWRRIGDGA